MTTELSLEKQFLLKQYEVVTLPSLDRSQMTCDIFLYSGIYIRMQHQLYELNGEAIAQYLINLACLRSLARCPKTQESTLRMLAIEAYGSYLRSHQQLQELSMQQNRGTR